MAQDANSQLLNMLSPQEGKLLDDQLRRRQLQEGVTNYGSDAMGRFLTAASGAQRASAGFGMLGERLIGGRQKGANELKAERQQEVVQQQKDKEKAAASELSNVTAKTESERYTQMAQIAANPNSLAFNPQKAEIYRDKAIAAKRNEVALKSSEMQLDALNTAKSERTNLTKAIEKVLPQLDMSDNEKILVGAMPPEAQFTYVQAEIKLKKKKARDAESLSKINALLPSSDTPISGQTSTDINNSYISAIKVARATGLTDEAEALESERKAIVDQKKTIEERERSTRKEWNSDPINRASVEATEQANKALELLKDGKGGYSDIAVLTTYMKALDPRSVVRGEEFDMAAGVGGVYNKGISLLTNFAKGERLTDEQKKELGHTITLLHNFAAKNYNTRRANQVSVFEGRLDTKFAFGDDLPIVDAVEPTGGEEPVNPDAIKETIGESLYNIYGL